MSKAPCGLTMKSEDDKDTCKKRRAVRSERGKLFACNYCSYAPKSDVRREISPNSLIVLKITSQKGSGNKIIQTERSF